MTAPRTSRSTGTRPTAAIRSSTKRPTSARRGDILVNGIPKSPLSYIHVVREDPVRRGLLYRGTENGLYVSFDDGETWQPLQNNMPRAPVYWIEIQEHFNDLVVATYGRGFWILDDITALRQLASEVTGKEAHLFTQRFAYRFQRSRRRWRSGTIPSGQNPPYGASINYWLKAPPSGDVTLNDPGSERARGTAPQWDQGRGAQPCAVGPARRADSTSPHANEPDVCAGDHAGSRRLASGA